MESLLLERTLGNLNTWQLSKVITEAFYYQISPLETPKFLTKSISSVNTLDCETTDHKYLLSGCADSSVKLWKVGNTSKPAQILGDLNKQTGGHSFGVTCVRWWPHDNGMFLSSSYDGCVKVWDSSTLEEAFSFDMGSKVGCFDINSCLGSSLVAVCSESAHVRILDLKTSSAVHSLTGHNGAITSCKWSPNNEYILATGSSEGEIRVWDIRKTNSCLTQLDLFNTDQSESGQLVNQSKKIGIFKNAVKAHANAVNGLLWLDSGKSLISTGNDDKIRVWDLDKQIGVNTLLNFGPFVKNRYQATKSMILSPLKETEIQYLWYPSDNSEILMFRVQDGKLMTRLRRTIKENSRSCCIAYAGYNTARYYSGTVDGKIRVWGPKEDDLEDELS